MNSHDKVVYLGYMNTKRVVSHMKQLARTASNRKTIQDLARYISGEDRVLESLFDHVYDNVVYRADPIQLQKLRTPERCLREGVGNCVDYSILISSVLLALGIPHKMRIISFGRRGQWEHVYIITNKGVVLDPVLGQKQDGTDSKYNRLNGLFNTETDYRVKKDFKVL